MKRFLILSVLLLSFFSLFVSCSAKNSRHLVLWTNCVEFVSYVELYNSLQDEVKIVALYKDSLETLLPPKADEQRPDIIAGSFLQSGIPKKYFSNLNSLFNDEMLSREIFYEPLLDAGYVDGKQFLLPVSFNLPALVFHTSNYDYTQANFLSFDAIKEISKEFNVQNKDGAYTAMGFAPHWNTDFLYLIFKTAGVVYNTSGRQISYTENVFNTTLRYINEWSKAVNDGIKNEQDFAFKYLYMPFYNQVQKGRCLFAYAPSNHIMTLSESQLENIDFRWIRNNDEIQIEDDAVMVGIYSASRNKVAARDFLVWFMSEDSQKKMLDRKFAMKLKTSTFGIAGGFSSVQSVNEKLFPVYYRSLLSNLPDSESLVFSQVFPLDWANIKEQVVLPFISACTEDSGAKIKPLNERYVDYLSLKQSL